MRNEAGTLSFYLVLFASLDKFWLLLLTYRRMNNEKTTINLINREMCWVIQP